MRRVISCSGPCAASSGRWPRRRRGGSSRSSSWSSAPSSRMSTSMPVRMRNGASSALSALDLVELGQQPLAVEAVGDGEAGGVVGDHEVLVAERRCAVRAIASIGAPPSLQVEWVWQSPRRAARSSAPSPGVDGGLGVELGQVARGSRRRVASAMTLPVDGADAGRGRCSVPAAWRRRRARRRRARATRSRGLARRPATRRTRGQRRGRAGRRRGRGASAGAIGRSSRGPRYRGSVRRCGAGPYPAAPWNASGSSASPTRASRRCTTPSPAAARWPRRTPSPPPTPTSAWPRSPTIASTPWPR